MRNFYNYWVKRSKWNSEQAALLFNSKDPRIDKNRVTFPIENDDFSGVTPGTWQWEALEDYFVFETGDWEGYSGGGPGSPKEASPIELIRMAMQSGIKIPKELYDTFGEHSRNNRTVIRSTSFPVMAWSGPIRTADKVDPQDSKFDSNEDLSKDKDNPHTSESDRSLALPDRPLTGIAKLFPLIIDGKGEANIAKWKGLAKKANENGLVAARVLKGGSAESMFDPWRVAEWLVSKGKNNRAEVNRRIKANLEPEYEDFMEGYGE